jgi:hypothetical protein
MIVSLARFANIRHDMPATNADTTHPSIYDQIRKDKHCTFEFGKVSVEEVKQLLLSINNDKPLGLTTWMENE